jgi:hypothetical protein
MRRFNSSRRWRIWRQSTARCKGESLKKIIFFLSFSFDYFLSFDSFWTGTIALFEVNFVFWCMFFRFGYLILIFAINYHTK